jgi:hypothetical protein
MRIHRTAWLLLGLALLIWGAFALHSWSIASGQKAAEAQREVAWRVATPRMEMAQEDAHKAVDARLRQVTHFFAERKKRVPAYASRVFSFRSKWELGWSKMPFTDRETHARFLKSEFSRLVFSEAELHQVVTQAIEDTVRDVQAIENTLLVKIRADLMDFPACAAALPDLKTESLFRDRFNQHLTSLSAKTGADTQLDVTRLVGSEIATAIVIRVSAAIAARLGVSAGIVGTGAALGPESLGVTLAIGLVVDQIVGWVIGWFYKPEEEVARKLNQELDQVAALLVNGDKSTRGLRQELQSLVARRKDLREAALREMILAPHP